ncbi:MAG TPA: tRNA (adenosine(37)-N6)-threonylcarbamoyltransferase complex dimerization subunit type 1 TsaB [Dermatophilaceae bacterium]|nr:tRNA (adenosine(37)-N6)-threonylcarbamoyltransferase complex dimerization subunit type 1 TsaB [Dermatophilaceae bacterium]
MLLLALDTSSSAITVALHDGARVVAESTVIDARAHAEHLAPGIRSVLRDAGRTAAEVTEVVVGRGPGPFTGLRVGLVTAAVFSSAVGAPVWGICSLDALAFQGLAQHPGACAGGVLATGDARRREVYWARYLPDPPGAWSPPTGAQVGALRRVDGPAVGPAHSLSDRPSDPLPDRPDHTSRVVPALPVLGRGGLLYPEAFGVHLPPLDVSAAALAELASWRAGQGLPHEPATPLYLRRPDARPAGERKRVLS